MDRDAILRSFHARHAGASPLVFHTGGDGPGESYERLADAVPQGPVLDLACGDGPLMELLCARDLDVTGVDMSPEELALARQRLGPNAHLEQAMAHDLPFADGSFGTVASHMAFMLMRPIDDIVAEIARVLRPGGRFIATIGCRTPPTDAARSFWTKYDELTSDLPPVPNFGDERVGTSETLAELFTAPTWSGYDDEEFAIVVPVPAGDLRSWFVRATYHVDMLPPDRLQRLLDWVDSERDRLAPGGTMEWTFGARQFAVTRGTRGP